jgi:hypothetical protein
MTLRVERCEAIFVVPNTPPPFIPPPRAGEPALRRFSGRVMPLGLPRENSVQERIIKQSELKSKLASIAGLEARRAASRDTP